MNDKQMVLLSALIIDFLFGDPPNRWHPVGWMGAFINWARNLSPAGRDREQLALGGLISLGGMSLAGGATWLSSITLNRLPRPLNWLLGGLALKTTFSWRGLITAGEGIYGALENEDLPEARRLLSWHLVSRDTAELNESQVTAATIESITENTSDSIVAPLFYYAVAGLPGAFTYRFANTADAMLGYRDLRREWLGKIPARVDDFLNLIPARLTAVLLIGAARLTGLEAKQAWYIWRRDRNKTASPNAGQPMSAAAGALGVQLEKVDHYKLGAELREPRYMDLRRSVQLVGATTILAASLAFLLSGRRER